MVNELKNNDGPWQSTVPQQMPWMSSYEPTSFNLQFGQQSAPNVPPTVTTSTINGDHMVQQHLYISSFPTTTTTSTTPITICPTAIAPNTLFTQGMSVPYMYSVTTTTQSGPILQPVVPLESQLIPLSSNNDHSNHSHNPQANAFDPTGLLTHIPYSRQQTAPADDKFSPQKRSSIEMEDDQIITEEPPTKQLLSEKKLFRQFGSLNIGGNINLTNKIDEYNSDDYDEDDERSQKTASDASGREEFNRYVYLLFKDKKNDGTPFRAVDSTLERLGREERDKLSKAVILWNPPTIFGNVEEIDDDSGDEDDEFKYKDHKDFLRKPLKRNNSLTITEVYDDDQCNNVSKQTNNSEPDELMLDD